MNSAFVFATPVAQAPVLGVLLGSPISIDTTTGACTIPIQQATGLNAPVPGTASTVTVPLTIADMQAILNTITARGVAAGVITAAGSISVT